MNPLVILGAGGLAKEVYWYALACGIEEIVFVDETLTSPTELTFGVRSRRVVNDWSAFVRDQGLTPFREFVVGVGDPALKRKLVRSARECGLEAAPTLIHGHAHVYGGDCTIGRGGVLAPGCRLTANVQIGDYVVLGVNCAIGHDAVIGDYVSCHPGCQVSGHVRVGAGTMLGTGTCIREKLTIAENVTVGAQSCVVKSIGEPNITVAGVPAHRLHSARPAVRRGVNDDAHEV